MNTYYGLRHGESEANIQGIIVSLPTNGLEHFGLTPHGAAQVASSCSAQKIESPIIVTSDFKRAIETAKIAAASYSTDYAINPLLRERKFNIFELQSNNHYRTVWKHDVLGQPLKGVESVIEVANRCKRLINQLEKQYSNKNILFVSHGDTLQITQCVLQGLPPARHREVPHFSPGELRIFAP